MEDPLPPEYTDEESIGHGAYGEVCKAFDTVRQRHVAIKRVYSNPVTTSYWGGQSKGCTEADALSRLHHPHVLQLHDVIRQQFCTLLVLELADTDLCTFLESKTLPRPLPAGIARTIMLHMLRGLAACHAQGILHRDLKPSNILSVQGCWKLGDFGQSRPEPQPGAPGRMSADVCTRWYRAPELLYGSRTYGASVDMWAAGCIFAELLGVAPVFQGNSDIDQLVSIMKQLGTINEERWPGCGQLPDYNKLLFNEMPPQPWESKLPGIDADAKALLQCMLCYPPDQRINVHAALEHPYFTKDKAEAVSTMHQTVLEALAGRPRMEHHQTLHL